MTADISPEASLVGQDLLLVGVAELFGLTHAHLTRALSAKLYCVFWLLSKETTIKRSALSKTLKKAQRNEQ